MISYVNKKLLKINKKEIEKINKWIQIKIFDPAK